MNDDLVANFVAVTGSDETQAISMLEATGYSLEEAVQLFFAASPQEAAPPTRPPPSPLGGGAGTSARGGGYHDDDDEAFARRLQQEANAVPSPGGEQEVRAPLPSKVERLYGDYFQQQQQLRGAGRNRNAGGGAASIDAFRDFRSNELEGEGGSGGREPGLASMFEPPRELLFNGNFEEAKQFAAAEGKWLIINLQSMSQFASYQLNRDTWRDSSVSALVQSAFILYQAYDVSDEAQKLQSYYQAYEVPAVIVVDPVTGAPMKHWTGFLDSERMAECLSPFLDTSFSDPGAARFAASLKRKKSGLGNQSGDAGGSGLGKSSRNEAAAGGGGGGDIIDVDEDAALQAALAASMGDNSAAGKAASQSQSAMEEDVVDLSGEAAAAGGAVPAFPRGPSAKEVAAAAAARLPEEVEGPRGCRVAVRFQDGSRKQRRFPRDAPLRSVHDWCLTHSEEAASGREFVLAEAAPGAAPLADLATTLESAGVADSMLVMKWTD